MTGPRRTPASRTAAARLSIGALSRASGIPVETLRTWERRYGYPVPERKPSGHRVYPVASVPRLRRIAAALAQGHRAREVVAASDQALMELLRSAPPPPETSAMPVARVDTEELLRAVERFDAERLTRVLLRDWAQMGPLPFLKTRVSPLVRAAGDAWESGRLEIRHEHFLSERIGDLLRALRLPLEERASGPLFVLATMPGEAHALGLQMAALLLASLGCRILFLGTEVPVAQVAALAKDLGARAVGISVSLASRTSVVAGHLQRLREALPHRIGLLVGGAGAPRARSGIEPMPHLEQLDAWARRLVTAA